MHFLLFIVHFLSGICAQAVQAALRDLGDGNQPFYTRYWNVVAQVRTHTILFSLLSISRINVLVFFFLFLSRMCRHHRGCQILPTLTIETGWVRRGLWIRPTTREHWLLLPPWKKTRIRLHHSGVVFVLILSSTRHLFILPLPVLWKPRIDLITSPNPFLSILTYQSIEAPKRCIQRDVYWTTQKVDGWLLVAATLTMQ